MNRIALGTAQFGMNYGIANKQGQVSIDEAKAILDYAKGQNIDTLDTAIAYGDSEQRLGEIGIQDWKVITKLPGLPEDCPNIKSWVYNLIKISIDRLRVPRLFGLLLHRPEELLSSKGKGLIQALQECKNDGLVNKIGISIYDPGELDKLCCRYDFDIVQAPFNIFDRRLIETGWISRFAEQGIELHVRSIFLQGLLLMKPEERPLKFSRWASLWSRWDKWLEQTGFSPVQACVQYTLSISGINMIVIGLDNVYQLKEILDAALFSVTQFPDELEINDIDLINPARWSSLV